MTVHQIRPSFIFLSLYVFTVVLGQPSFRPQSIIDRYLHSSCNTKSNTGLGTCHTQNDCLARKGIPDGTCASGFASCCNFKFTCGRRMKGETDDNDTIFVNKQYPHTDNGTNTCQVTIDKQPNICQLRLDFKEFSLSQPDENGQCTTDSFMVRTTVGERLPILCGDNNGQHLYVDMGRGSANPVVLSVVTNGNNIGRKWKIKINMIPCNNLDMAPSGCLQYFRYPSSTVRSFNYGPPFERSRSLSNLTYTSCIRVEENFCAIKWQKEESNSFLWGASNVVPLNTLNVSFIAVNNNVVISRSKPFLLKVTPNSVFTDNVRHSQNRFLLRYVQLPCVN